MRDSSTGGRVTLSRPREDENGRVKDAEGNLLWEDDDEVVQGLVLLRKGAESLPALKLVKAKHPELPVVVVSTLDIQSLIIEAIELGAQSFVGKPFEPGQILKAVALALAERG